MTLKGIITASLGNILEMREKVFFLLPLTFCGHEPCILNIMQYETILQEEELPVSFMTTEGATVIHRC